jgi:hypothetical protein
MVRPEFKGDLEVTEAHVAAVAKCVPLHCSAHVD